jgi:hypothetical protein
MNLILKFAAITAVLCFSCRTQNSTSILRDATTESNPAEESFDVENLKNSNWESTFDGGKLKIKLNLHFGNHGEGTITSSSVEEEIVKAFATFRLADINEFQKALKLFGSDTFADSNRVQINIKQAIMLLDKRGNTVHILPILHHNELLVYPVGSVIRLRK